MKFFLGVFLTFIISFLNFAPLYANETSPRLYRLHCGSIHVSNLNVFSDTYAYVGQKKDLVSSCYLINHKGEWMLWDAGLPADLKGKPYGESKWVFTYKLEQTILDQLPALGISWQDIKHLGLSHTHNDHSAQADFFKNATLYVQGKELDIFTHHPHEARSHGLKDSNIAFFLDPRQETQLKRLDGDYDVFGDGRVVILSAPGHTPGHQALLVKLENKGPVLLSGDQWHFLENYETDGVPSFNYDRTYTQASSARLKEIEKNLDAELIIQHEPSHVNKLPAFPAYAD